MVLKVNLYVDWISCFNSQQTQNICISFFLQKCSAIISTQLLRIIHCSMLTFGGIKQLLRIKLIGLKLTDMSVLAVVFVEKCLILLQVICQPNKHWLGQKFMFKFTWYMYLFKEMNAKGFYLLLFSLSTKNPFTNTPKCLFCCLGSCWIISSQPESLWLT